MQKNNLFIFYFFFVFIFIISTNSHFSYEESLRFGGADGFSYMSISKDFPSITSEKIMSIHAERFFFPYVIGFISKLLNMELYFTYKVTVLIVLVIINFFTIKILRFLNINTITILTLLTLINFNPYITRFYIAVPTILNDLIFVLGTLIILHKIITNKNNDFLISTGYIFAFASRQTSLGLVLGYLVSMFVKGKTLLSKKNEIFGLVIFIIFLILNFYYSSNTSQNLASMYELYSPKMRILGLFIQNVPLNEKLVFLFLPFLSFGPLILYFVAVRKIKLPIKKAIKSKMIIFLFSFILLVILQPILSGAEVTGRNILRLTSLAYIPLVIGLIMITKKRNNNILSEKFILTITIFVTIFHSFHPTFSNIGIFNFLRF